MPAEHGTAQPSRAKQVDRRFMAAAIRLSRETCRPDLDQPFGRHADRARRRRRAGDRRARRHRDRRPAACRDRGAGRGRRAGARRHRLCHAGTLRPSRPHAALRQRAGRRPASRASSARPAIPIRACRARAMRSCARPASRWSRSVLADEAADADGRLSHSIARRSGRK